MNHADRKVTIVGLTQLVTECPALMAEAPQLMYGVRSTRRSARGMDGRLTLMLWYLCCDGPIRGNLLFALARVIMMPDDAEDDGSDEDEFDIGPSDYQAVHAPVRTWGVGQHYQTP